MLVQVLPPSQTAGLSAGYWGCWIRGWRLLRPRKGWIQMLADQLPLLRPRCFPAFLLWALLGPDRLLVACPGLVPELMSSRRRLVQPVETRSSALVGLPFLPSCPLQGPSPWVALVCP